MRPVGSKYVLEEPLGRGATGTVWRSQVRDTGETVAIKVLKEELASDPDIVMRFLRERSVLVRLSHPHIVKVRDLVVEGDLLALVMDLIDGPDLYRYLRENGPFSPVATALLTAAVADALASSHADGVVHRDLKPANVLLATVTGPDGNAQMHPMLTDFGIARLADSPGVTRTHEFVGTPAYIAPEAAQGQPQTSAVDVYGAGILMYELLTGHAPFRGDSAIEVLHMHLSQQPRRPSTVPEPLWTVIERCLRKSPAERPSAENLARALRVVASGIGVHASPAAAEAAFGVAALLGPDPEPTTVPDQQLVPPGAADPTQVLSRQAQQAYDPNAATSVLPAGAAGPAGADGTRVMPPMPGTAPAAAAAQPQGPHPWESQLNAARNRAEQTEVQYLNPDQDPLRRRPRRQPAPPTAPPAAQQQQPQQQQQPYGQQQPQQPPQQPYRQPQPPPQQQQPRYQQPQPQPQRYEPQRPPPAEPAPRREPRQRSANPVKIPGLGCLKGCFTMILVLVVIFLLAWYVGPLQDWFNTGKGLWASVSDWVTTAWDWVSTIGDAASNAPSGLPGQGGGPGGQ
ncbi:serine/threonine-protein kinase [Streptomyces sp. NBC_01262]|uniref:serine/threonine-protein kinase n=1 Tax=Streptomyces sp. NBC_01262 TaxID=2903803 RepID=UPI002E2F4715|nr:serine/threonine-protein kinase [Streptomyces sp. NBC_01262]